MKTQILVLITFCLVSSFTLSAQYQVEQPNEEFQIMNDYEIASGKMSDTKSMFKLTTSGGSLQDLWLSYELKLFKSFSLGVSLNGSRFYSFVPVFSPNPNPTPIILDTISLIQPIESFQSVRTYQLQASIEGRYYINQEALIEEGFGNNLNGIYTVAGLRSVLYNSQLNQERYIPYIGIGLQSRILKYGLLDFSLLAELEDNRFRIAPVLSAGFAFSKNYKPLELENARCNILKCFVEKKYLLKVPLKGLLSMNFFPDRRFVSIFARPKIEFEHRIIKGLSMNHALSGNTVFNINFPREVASSISQAQISYGNNLRYYFLKKKNIMKGKSADNLSGVYAATSLSISRFYSNRFNEGGLQHFQNIVYGGVDLGYQARLFKNFYFDFNVYLGRQKTTVASASKPIFPTSDDFFTRYGLNLDFGILL